MIRVIHPGSGSRSLTFYPSPDPGTRGSKRHRIPDPDLQHWINPRRLITLLTRASKLAPCLTAWKSVRTRPLCLKTGRSPRGVQKGLLLERWTTGAPENLAKARIFRHSGWTEGRPQSPDQQSTLKFRMLRVRSSFIWFGFKLLLRCLDPE